MKFYTNIHAHYCGSDRHSKKEMPLMRNIFLKPESQSMSSSS